jgi:hypothetical protein
MKVLGLEENVLHGDQEVTEESPHFVVQADVELVLLLQQLLLLQI